MTDTNFEPDLDNPDLVHWSPRRGHAFGGGSTPNLSPDALSQGLAIAGVALAATAVGALAVGAMAVGALAVGRLAVGRASFRDVRIGRLVVDDLVILEPRDGLGRTR